MIVTLIGDHQKADGTNYQGKEMKMNFIKSLLAAIGAAFVVLAIAIAISIATTPEFPRRTHVQVCADAVSSIEANVSYEKDDCESYDLITYEDGQQVRIPRP